MRSRFRTAAKNITLISLAISAAPSHSAAGDEVFGDWTVTPMANGSVMTATVNDGGALFGAVCGSAGCTAFFDLRRECDDGDPYPALASAPAGGFSVRLICEKLGKNYVLNFPVDKAVMDSMSIGGVFGLAYPLNSGQFQVARFSLTGAARALARAQQLAAQAPAGKRREASDNYSM